MNAKDHKSITHRNNQNSVKSHMPSFLRIEINVFSSRGFVSISASCSEVNTNSSTISPLRTWSRMKWCFMSICFVLECCIGFFEMFIALVLSHKIGIFEVTISKSKSCCLIHKIWATQLPAATYSDLAVDSATKFYFFENQDISEFPKNWQVPDVLFLSNWLLAWSVSLEPTKSKQSFLGYHKPTFLEPFKYLKILFTTLRWESFGHD